MFSFVCGNCLCLPFWKSHRTPLSHSHCYACRQDRNGKLSETVTEIRTSVSLFFSLILKNESQPKSHAGVTFSGALERPALRARISTNEHITLSHIAMSEWLVNNVAQIFSFLCGSHGVDQRL